MQLTFTLTHLSIAVKWIDRAKFYTIWQIYLKCRIEKNWWGQYVRIRWACRVRSRRLRDTKLHWGSRIALEAPLNVSARRYSEFPEMEFPKNLYMISIITTDISRYLVRIEVVTHLFRANSWSSNFSTHHQTIINGWFLQRVKPMFDFSF